MEVIDLSLNVRSYRHNGVIRHFQTECSTYASLSTNFFFITARIRRVTADLGGGGTPILPNGGQVHPSCWQGVPPNGQRGYPAHPEWMGVPPGQGWMGYPPDWKWVPPSGLDGGIPPSELDELVTPSPPPTPSEDRAAEQALATWQAVCLLRSRRITFLFGDCFNFFNNIA